MSKPSRADRTAAITSDTGPFAIVPEWVIDSDVSDRAVRLYAVLGRYTDRDDKAFPSRRRLATRMRCSTDSVDRAIRELVALGAVDVEERFETDDEGAHRQTSNRYTLHRLRNPSRTAAEGGGVTPAEPPSRTAAEPVTTTTKNDSHVERDKDAIQRIYDHWRKARGKTRSSYDKISSARRQKIVSRLREFPEPDLIAAIDAVDADPWRERALHDDLTVIFRSREQVDRFLEMAQRTSTPLERAISWLRTVGWQYSDEAIWEDLGKFGLTDEQRRELAGEAQRIQAERSAA